MLLPYLYALKKPVLPPYCIIREHQPNNSNTNVNEPITLMNLRKQRHAVCFIIFLYNDGYFPLFLSNLLCSGTVPSPNNSKVV